MGKRRKKLLIMLSVSAIAFVAEAMDREVLVDEDFESYEVGRIPMGLWQSSRAGASGIRVTDDAAGGARCLLVEGISNTNAGFLKRSCPVTSSEPLLILRYRIKTAAHPGNAHWGSLVQVYSDGEEVFRTRWYDDAMWYHSGSRKIHRMADGNDTATWHTYKAIMDRERRRVDVYWDGEAVFTDLPLFDWAIPRNWKNIELRLGFWPGGGMGYRHYYDDITLFSAPRPRREHPGNLSVGGARNGTGETEMSVCYDYMPWHHMGDFEIRMRAGRFLEVSWRGRNILTQGGELFSRRYSAQDTNKFPGNPLGMYIVEDWKAPFDVPVRVEESKGKLIYTWCCADTASGYRQINEAVVTDHRFNLRSTLEFRSDVPKEIRFHPVLFPGEALSYNRGRPDEALPGLSFEMRGRDGGRTNIIYPDEMPNGPWCEGDWESMKVELPHGALRIGVRSDDPDAGVALYALAQWPYGTSHQGRRGLVVDLNMTPDDTGESSQTTYEITIEAVDSSVAADESGEQSKAPAPVAFSDLKLTVDRGDRAFWFLRPGEVVNLDVLADNQWSAEKKTAALRCEVHDYQNRLVRVVVDSVEIPAVGLLRHTVALGSFSRGIYSVSLNAYDNDDRSIGHTAFRMGVIPERDLRNREPALGAFQMQPDSIAAKVELAKWLGLGCIRFRSGNREERWRNFEPKRGEYLQELEGVEIARAFSDAGMDVVHEGGSFPSDRYPSWLGTDDVDYALWDGWSGEHGRHLPKDRSLFTAYVQAWATNYAGLINGFEVFNEPRHSSDPAKAAEVVELMNKAIKGVLPEARILTADTCHIDSETMEWVDELLAHASNSIDVITYHQYQGGLWLKQSRHKKFVPIEETGWEDELKQVMRLGKKYGKPVWNGEISWVGCPRELFAHPEFEAAERDTANILVRSYLLTRAAGVRNIINCFTLSLRKPDREYTVYPAMAAGAVGWHRQIKPRTVAHATLARLLDGAEFVERIQTVDPRVYILCFKRAKCVFAAAWRTRGEVEIGNPLADDDVRVMAIDGHELPNTDRLVLSPSPVYLVSDCLSSGEFREKLRGSIRVGRDSSLNPVSLSYDQAGQTMTLLAMAFDGQVATQSFPIAFHKSEMLLPEVVSMGEGGAVVALSARGLPGGKTAITASIGERRLATMFHLLAGTQEGELGECRLEAMKVASDTGDLKGVDWEKSAPIRLDARTQVSIAKKHADDPKHAWQGPEDLSATAYLLYDDSNFYFRADVKDDVHINRETKQDRVWSGDAIQVAIDTCCDTRHAHTRHFDNNDHEITIGLTGNGAVIYRRSRSFGNNLVEEDGNISTAKVEINRIENEKLTRYLLAVPFKELLPLGPHPDRRVVKFNFIVNDDDGLTDLRTKWIGITKGIAEIKKPEIYRDLVFSGRE